MRNLKTNSILISFLLLFSGCVAHPPPDLSLNSTEPPDLEQQWSKYNAVYEYDQLTVNQTFNDLNYNMETNFVIDKKIRILNQEGLKYGTIEIPMLGEQITSFSVKLLDQMNKEVSIDLEEIKKYYIDNSKIVVPKVKIGSKIVIRIGFSSPRPLHSHEYYFKREIPVLLGRLIFQYSSDYIFRTKEYGGAPKPTSYNSTDKIFVWKQSPILPYNRLENKWTIDNLPRVALSLKGYYGEYVYQSGSWSEMAIAYKKYFIPKTLLQNTSQIKKIIQKITSKSSSTRDKAEKILDYVQQNISFHDTDNELINLAEVLEKRQADRYEMTVLLHEMYKIAGIKSKIVATRSKNRGGFDPDFATYRVLNWPLVLVEIEGKKEIAFPFSKNRKLGEFPFTYFDLQALDINSGKICNLPHPKYSQLSNESKISYDIASPNKPLNWSLLYDDYYSSYKKAVLDDKSQKDRKKNIQQDLEGNYDVENKVKDVSITGLNDKNKNLKIKMKVENQNIVIPRKKENYYSLAPLFKTFFTNYDSSSTLDFEYGIDHKYIDNITLKNINQRKTNVSFACDEIHNLLFSSSCFIEKKANKTILKRVVKINKSRISHLQMKKLVPDIQKLNRIKESYIVEKK